MHSPADITTTRVLEDLRSAFLQFGEAVRQALAEADLSARKQEDRLAEAADRWHAEGRRAKQEVRAAEIELQRRRRLKIGDRSPDTTEQEEILRRAQARLDLAREKAEAVRRWQRDWPQAVLEVQGPVRQLAFYAETDVPRLAAFLRDRIADLEAYARGEGT